jgi:hypothetical protein
VIFGVWMKGQRLGCVVGRGGKFCWSGAWEDADFAALGGEGFVVQSIDGTGRVSVVSQCISF